MGFRENLKEQLNFSGMYVKELAALSGVKKQTLDTYLNVNNCMPSADAAVSIAQALGVTVEYLVTGRETKHKQVQYPIEAKIAAETIAQLEAKNRKMAVAIIKSMKKQEDEEKAGELKLGAIYPPSTGSRANGRAQYAAERAPKKKG